VESLGYYTCVLGAYTGYSQTSMPYPAQAGTSRCLFADSLQGQTWAQTLGLGMLLTNHTRILSHYAKQKQYNGTPFGHISVSQRLGKGDATPMDTTLWATGTYNYAANELWMYWSDNTSSLFDPNPIEEPMKDVINIRDGMKDFWNYPGSVYNSTGGVSYFLSHYGFHMLGYSIWPAWTQQRSNMVTGTLSLNPALNPQIGVFPIFFPGSGGLVTVNTTCLIIRINFGSVNLTSVTFGIAQRNWQFPLTTITSNSPDFVLSF
jgi:hypothetical protein